MNLSSTRGTFFDGIAYQPYTKLEERESEKSEQNIKTWMLVWLEFSMGSLFLSFVVIFLFLVPLLSQKSFQNTF